MLYGAPTDELQVVPGAGHVSNLDAPEFVTGALRAFLDRVGSQPATDSAGHGGE